VPSFESISLSLAPSGQPTTVFFRNDDAGWSDHRLASLCECFIEHRIPLDIAVIPKAMSSDSVSLLRSLMASAPTLLHIHQHGFSHANHQTSGRSCEFGNERSALQQFNDIAQGKDILEGCFGDKLEPFFTPPWNRCVRDTFDALKNLGFRLVSRIAGSDDKKQACFPELPVTIDWLKKHKGERLRHEQFCTYACDVLASRDRHNAVGIMLHHAAMDQYERQRLAKFLVTMRNNPGVRFGSIAEIADRSAI
jgi:hypothetical protein